MSHIPFRRRSIKYPLVRRLEPPIILAIFQPRHLHEFNVIPRSNLITCTDIYAGGFGASENRISLSGTRYTKYNYNGFAFADGQCLWLVTEAA